jgi:hypothetical protein
LPPEPVIDRLLGLGGVYLPDVSNHRELVALGRVTPSTAMWDGVRVDGHLRRCLPKVVAQAGAVGVVEEVDDHGFLPPRSIAIIAAIMARASSSSSLGS